MLQIVIWMLCVYLVLKGAEIWHIAAASSHESRTSNMRVAAAWGVLAVLAAIFFFWLSIEQTSQMQMPQIPSYTPYN